MQIAPYLFFNGHAEAAIAFYRHAIGAEVGMQMRYKEAPDQSMINPANANYIMHASLKAGDSWVLLSDGHCSGTTDFKGFSLSLTVKTDAEAAQCFAALAEGGKITMPMTKTFWASSFGAVEDKFGLVWMVSCEV